MAGLMRAERTPGGQFATRSSEVKAPFPHQYHHQLHPFAPNPHLPTTSLDDRHEPPTKRRKIVVQGKQQTTLDHHYFTIAQSEPPGPPTNATLSQPHGRITETLNGRPTALRTDEDELSSPAVLHIDDAAHQQPQPAAVPTPANSAPPDRRKVDKRTLRSQDEGPRLKSELALYFPNYEDVMFDVRRDSDFITLDTAIYITDDTPRHVSSAQASAAKTTAAPSLARTSSIDGTVLLPTTQRSATNSHNGSQFVSFDMIARTLPDDPEDPLTDAHFFKSHRRAERKEKQLRNIERERAMHEKVQLERILDGLQGHDWLKVLGITGITDGEARRHEGKRDHFIAEVQFLIDKFRQWKEEEKRQRLEREVARHDEESEEPETEAGSVEPPSSDLNARAARQLQQETANTVRVATPKPSVKGKLALASTAAPLRPAMPPPLPSPELPITSFYPKRHLRDTALGKSRHGRNVTAFGQLIPDMEDREFELPPEYVTEDTLRANARERRRRKRASLVDAV